MPDLSPLDRAIRAARRGHTVAAPEPGGMFVNDA